MVRSELRVLNVRVDSLSRSEIFDMVENFLDNEKFHQVATVNPEFVLEAQKNKDFFDIINNCDLNIADGIGIWFAFLRHGRYLKCRLAGADMMLDILKRAENRRLGVFLACRKDGLSNYEETRAAILRICPNLPVSGDNIDPESFEYQMPDAQCPILLCNFGAPKQEAFINSVKSDKIRLAMGIGGSFDFLTGKARRAPLFLRRAGLEWLWRIFQPQEWRFKKQRIKRIVRTVIIFPIKIIFCKQING